MSCPVKKARGATDIGGGGVSLVTGLKQTRENTHMAHSDFFKLSLLSIAICLALVLQNVPYGLG